MKTCPPPGTYRYATDRVEGEGLRIGVTRHVPRGVSKGDWKKRGYFDLWLPLLSPSAELLKTYRDEKITWAVFARRYRTEMKRPECRQVIDLLATFSLSTPFGIGCFCVDESHCHRSLLLPLILASRKSLTPSQMSTPAYASPPCYLAELGGVMDD